MYKAVREKCEFVCAQYVDNLQDLSARGRLLASDLSWAYRAAFGTRLIGFKHRGRFIMRTLFNLQASALWFRFLKESYLRELVAREPGFIETIHRPFYDKNISAINRGRLLKSHYELLQAIFGPRRTERVMSGAGVLLCRFAGKNGEDFQINLLHENTFKREGGVTLELSLNNAALLCLTFTLARVDREILIKVGGAQAKGNNCRSLVRDATHALSGIQPRLLLIEALRVIANQVGCTKIECIGADNHVYRAWRYRSKQPITAQYDQLWLLAGGKLNQSGNFDIPSYVAEKPIDSRPSKKRSEYRRRAIVLKSMRQQICDTMQGERDTDLPDRMPAAACCAS